jgi:uncharacterized protein (TIGR01319 family)
MVIWICLDIGSTWTKAAAVDPEALRVVGMARARTTADTDVNIGVADALESLSPCIAGQAVVRRLACSSAAGGLRMVAVGLVPELTAEAARRTAFSAGAKVMRTFTHELTSADLKELEAIHPDILLLCGGTDGGNRRVLLNNAAAIASLEVDFPIVLAGNRSVAEIAAELLVRGGKSVRITENVMPEFNRLNLEPAREVIREVFLAHIVRAKGLDRVVSLIDGILMPTPYAVMDAVRLLAEGYGGESGWGDLIALDAGGATTDVYSMAGGEPTLPGVVWKGLPEPYAKRTVEGDLGVRHNALSITETFGRGLDGVTQLASMAQVSPAEAARWLDEISRDPGVLPSAETARIDSALAVRAMQVALRRHAGILEESFSPMGRILLQTGKDLSAVRRVLLTGGPPLAAEDPCGMAADVLAGTARQPSGPAGCSPDAGGQADPHRNILLPLKMDAYLDKSYILAAMGLLAAEQPVAALRIMKKEMTAL